MRFVDRHPLAWLACLAVVAALGLLLPAYWVYLLSAAGIGTLIARGIGLVTHQTGIILLCQMSFAAIGGWFVSWLALLAPALPFPVLVLAGGIAAAPFGALLGLITLRVRGVELAVVMLGFAAALDLVLIRDGFPGTATGTAVIPKPPLTDPFWFVLLTWGIVVLVHAAMVWVSRSPVGLAWSALRSSERAAASLGVHRGAAKSTALAFGACSAGLAGGLLAGQYGLLSAEVFSPLTSLVHLAIAVMFGASLLSGAVFAGTLSVLMPELLRRLGVPLDVGNALFAIGAIDVLRRGHGGVAEQLTAKAEARAFAGVPTGCRFPAQTPAVRTEVPAGARGLVLEVRDLTVKFGAVTALDRVSFDVEHGEVHALIGPNGAGKSTLIDAVTGFLPATSGETLLLGQSLGGLSARQRAQRGIRRTFQQSRVVDTITVDEYLRLAARGATTDRIDDLRTSFGLPRGDVPIRLMDVGSRRILEIAGALASSPSVVLLDEPAAGLDDETATALAERIRVIPQTYLASVVLIEHDMRLIRSAAHRVTVLDKGGVLRTGRVSDVLAHPDVVTAYLGTEAGQ